MADPTTLRVGRTRFVRAASRLGHERLLRLERLRRRNPLVRAAATPLRWWLRRGSMRVGGGPAEGLRLSMGHLPLAHAHTGLLARGWLEVSVQEALRRLLAEGDVFYDLGANVGFFALLGARFVGPAGRVYAFEPVPESAEAARTNAELNGLLNVTVVQKAVGAAAGRDRLLLVEDLSWSHLENLGSHPRAQGALDVEVIAIEDLVREGTIEPP